MARELVVKMWLAQYLYKLVLDWVLYTRLDFITVISEWSFRSVKIMLVVKF